MEMQTVAKLINRTF